MALALPIPSVTSTSQPLAMAQEMLSSAKDGATNSLATCGTASSAGILLGEAVPLEPRSGRHKQRYAPSGERLVAG